VLARAVHPDPGLAPAGGEDPLGRGLVERQGGRAAQVILGQAGRGEDFPHPVDMEVLARVTGGRQRQQLASEIEPAPDHRHRLERLVRRTGENRGIDIAALFGYLPARGEPGRRAAMPGFDEA
jgi:hypothetical protein